VPQRLFSAEQARIVGPLIERVVVGPAGTDIGLRLDGLGGLVRDLTAIAPDVREHRRDQLSRLPVQHANY